jgi:hypothetical protein
VPLIFPSGSTDGAEVCTPVAANHDDFVEFEENFAIQLALETPGGNILRLGNSVTTVFLTDINGMAV